MARTRQKKRTDMVVKPVSRPMEVVNEDEPTDNPITPKPVEAISVATTSTRSTRSTARVTLNTIVLPQSTTKVVSESAGSRLRADRKASTRSPASTSVGSPAQPSVLPTIHSPVCSPSLSEASSVSQSPIRTPMRSSGLSPINTSLKSPDQSPVLLDRPSVEPAVIITPNSPDELDETQPETFNFNRISSVGAPKVHPSPCRSSINQSLSISIREAEQSRHYMSPNDAQCSAVYGALEASALSPQMEATVDKLNISPSQSIAKESSYSRDNLMEKSIFIRGNQTVNSELNFETNFYFLHEATEEKKEKPETMQNAYDCLFNRGFIVKWVSGAEAITVADDTDLIICNFVLSKFDGKIFDYLHTQERCKIYSPLAIVHFFSQQIPERNYPIMDVCMRQCYVTSTGLPRSVRVDLENKMRLMSALISSSLKDRTTHIVATSWDSEKCMYARTHGHPLVMNTHWVEYCWDNCQQEEAIDAYQLSYDRNFRLPVFTGFVICGPNLTRRGQDTLCQLVTENGGIYEDKLYPYRTTHIVMVKREGAIYEKAIEMERIKVVSIDWIHESIKRGYPILEEDISVKKVMNRLAFKMMNFFGFGPNSLTEIFDDHLRAEVDSANSMILIPGSPEFDELQELEENGENEEINED